MAIDNSSLMGIALLGSMKRAERKLASTPMMLTLVPGAPAARSALATVAVGSQARDAVRRQNRVVRDTLDVATEIIADPGTPVKDHLLRHPALKDLTVIPRFEQFGQEVAVPAGSAAEADLALAAEMVTAALTMNKGDLFSTQEAAKYQTFLDRLPAAAVAKIVKP